MAITTQLSSTSYKVLATDGSGSTDYEKIFNQLDDTGTGKPDVTNSKVVSFNVTYKTETSNNTTTTYAIVSVTRKP